MKNRRAKLRTGLAFVVMEPVLRTPFLVSASSRRASICRRFGRRLSGARMEMLRQAASILSPVAQVSPFASKVRALAGSAGTVASRPRSLLLLT
jgi:hypothetical protein